MFSIKNRKENKLLYILPNNNNSSKNALDVCSATWTNVFLKINISGFGIKDIGIQLGFFKRFLETIYCEFLLFFSQSNASHSIFMWSCIHRILFYLWMTEWNFFLSYAVYLIALLCFYLSNFTILKTHMAR